VRGEKMASAGGLRGEESVARAEEDGARERIERLRPHGIGDDDTKRLSARFSRVSYMGNNVTPVSPW